IAVFSISLYAALSDAQNLSLRWFTRDDAYYYFKVAQNISEGYGSTFDGINPTNGYHPLWLWICVPIFALARFDLILPLRILLLAMSMLSLGTAILFYRLIGKIFTPAIGAIAATYWAFSRNVLDRVYQQGLETGIAAFLIVLFVYKLYEFEKMWRTNPVTRKQLASLGIIAVLVAFSRLDLIFFVGMAGIWIIFREHPLRYLLPFDIVAVIVSVLLGFIYRVSFDEFLKYSDVALTMIAISMIVKIFSAFLFGLYKNPNQINREELAKSLLLFSGFAATLTGIIMIVLQPLTNFEGFPRTIILYDFILTTFLFGITRYASFGLRSKTSNLEKRARPFQELRENWKTWLNNGLVYYGIVGSAMALYMLWSKLTFGTSSPVSGQIKRWWGSLSGKVYGGSVQNTLSFFGVDYSNDANAWHPVSSTLGRLAELADIARILVTYRYLVITMLAILLFYIVLLINRQKARTAMAQLGIIPLFCGAWIQVISYHITGYAAFKEWYWISQLITEVLVIALIAGMLHQAIPRKTIMPNLLWLLTIAVFILMGTSFWTTIQNQMQYNRWNATDPNNDLAAFLEEHTQPGSIIGMTGGGNAGYFVDDRTIINMDGLINSYDYFNLLKSKSAGDYLMETGMDYILANPTILGQLPYRNQFEPYIKATGVRYGGKDLMRYQAPSP
ncbi:MAG TPA: hypothetical protein VLA72_20560, partial [Anaerolineales bacterium]|nr:hypothetical protein [Anaerolineales bacterium]